MAAEYPPFMNGYGTAAKILGKIIEAQTPDRFTQDFLSTKLGFPGGTAKPFIPLAKRLGLLEGDGKPSDLYKAFRNHSHSKAAMASAIRKGYSQFYERNEYAHDLDKKKLEGLVVEITGLEAGHATTRAIVGTFETLKSFADFNKPEIHKVGPIEEKAASVLKSSLEVEALNEDSSDIKLNLAYTINLVLPKTDDVAVFNAIFKSLREHLLNK
ncbi:MAG: DUF5343 domain-containing protein [Polynucleobacter sp.]|jgi:hypothetical protein|uniref:DUF5343 domain-containing protein n=1 Tax=Limnobacter sp. TaxID=2003368 RepID=UPI002732507C|nr:DUF5343 domain-containing protein [Limnobacter sp.]MDP3272020.1 DUF5343 domain-containing protein [Limnobacter sp.]MDZ4056450.1 DUF5343 domain-containing protein [Polynucleobacter sp.]